MNFDVREIRKDFPILEQTVNNRRLVYFDNAATTQKPRRVIDKIVEVYTQYNANVHRGVHHLSNLATTAMEESRQTVRRFLNAASEREIIFTRGATESINLVANSFSQQFMSEGDEVIVTEMEHHSNLVPWQLLENQHKAKVVKWAFDDRGELNLAELEELITDRTKLLSIVYVSNTLGTINPVEQIIEIAHSHNIPVLVDASQAIQHFAIDVQQLDCDFLVFSGHKIYGPTGVGVLYGKYAVLDSMPPWHGGGEMIKNVTFEKTTYADVPARFEAGTPAIAEVIGLGKAIEWLNRVGLDEIRQHESKLVEYALKRLAEIPQVKVLGNPKERGALLSVTLDGIAVSDAAMILDEENVAVRSGHHCAQPVMDRFGVDATLRLSFGAYTLERDIDRFVAGIQRVLRLFA